MTVKEQAARMFYALYAARKERLRNSRTIKDTGAAVPDTAILP